MIVTITIFIIMANYAILPCGASSMRYLYSADSNHHDDSFILNRRMRSLYSLGFDVIQALTNGARRLFATEFGEVFVKSGGYRQGLRDFESIDSMKVTDIKKHGIVVRKVGVVGGRKFILDKGDQTYPPKLIIQTDKPFSSAANSNFVKDVIIYSNNAGTGTKYKFQRF